MAKRKHFRNKDLGAKISAACETSGISYAELGRKIGVARQQVYRWVSGECSPSSTTLRKIAVAVGVSGDSLLGLDGEEEKGTKTLTTGR